MKTPITRLVCRGALVAVVASAPVIPAWSGINPATERSADTAPLAEIIVTAHKREQPLQQVPAAVSVFSGEKLTNARIGKIRDLDAYVPSLFMAEAGIGNQLAIRGIFSGVNPGFEQSAGTYVDGIYRGRPQQTRMPFLDVTRIEVLRGPQSILLGKNSVAGALNITTASPTSEFEGTVSAVYETQFDGHEITTVVSGPFADTLRGRFAGRLAQTDGYMENLTLSSTEPAREEWGMRAAIDWDASDALSLTLKAEQGEFDVSGRYGEVFLELPSSSGPFAGSTFSQILVALGQDGSVLNNTQDYKRSGNGDFSDNETEEYLLKANWTLGSDHDVTAISGYSGYAFSEKVDADSTGGDVINVNLAEEFQQFSQEIRLSSPIGGTYEYIAGLYYQHSDVTYREAIQIDQGSVIVPLLDANPMLPPMSGSIALADTAVARLFEQKDTSVAAFLQGTWTIMEAFRLTGGLRYVREDKDSFRTLRITDISGGQAPSPLTPVLYASLFNTRPHSLAGSRHEEHLLPSVNAAWDAVDDVMLYLTWSKGTKAGGFDARSNNSPANGGTFELEDEEADSYELGAKMRVAGLAELNVAVYYTDYENLQVSVFDGVIGFNVGNAAAAEVQGIELDARWAVTPRFTLSAALAHTDFEFKEYLGQCYVGRVPDAADGINCSYAGKTNQFVADWSGVFGADYRHPLRRQVELELSVDVLYSDDYFRAPTLDPHQLQESYAQLNARVSVGDAAGRWRLALIGTNLTDEVVMPFGNDIPLAARTFGAPSYAAFVNARAQVAIEATVRF